MTQQYPAPLTTPSAAPHTPQQGNGLALAGMIIAILALLLCLIPVVNGFALVLAVLALIFGIVGIAKAGKRGGAGRGMAVAAIIMSVLAGVGFAVSTAITLAAVDAVDESMTQLDADLGRLDGSATEDILAEDLTVTIGAFEATADEFGLVESRLPVSLTNNAAESFSYMVQIEAVDAAGNRIADDTLYTSELGSGQSEELELFLFVAQEDVEALRTAQFRVVEVSQL